VSDDFYRRSLDQIKAAIQIMSQCIIMISKGKKEIWKGAILQDLVTVKCLAL
jgi:hypothetical protein